MSKLTRRYFLKSAIGAVSAAILPLSTEAEQDKSLERKVEKYEIGDQNEAIELRLTKKPGYDVTFFNMHDDEDTAVRAAEKVVNEYGGGLIELNHKGTRHVTFHLKGQDYRFDPNRIFSDVGIIDTLNSYDPAAFNHIKNFRDWFNEPAFGEVKRFREWLLQQYSLGESKVMVAVHNNTDGGYSVTDYLKGGKYEADAKKAVQAESKDTDNFFFVTNEGDYNRLALQGFNVVLQDNEKVKDDGSLSAYWGKKKKTPYINVEAQGKRQYNHLEEQALMISAAIRPYKQ